MKIGHCRIEFQSFDRGMGGLQNLNPNNRCGIMNKKTLRKKKPVDQLPNHSEIWTPTINTLNLLNQLVGGGGDTLEILTNKISKYSLG